MHAVSRTNFPTELGIAMVGVGLAPLWLARSLAREAWPRRRKKVLVAIFQRGAADGLNMVVPLGEQQYYALRPTIAIPRPAASERSYRSGWFLRAASIAGAVEAAVGSAGNWRSCMRPAPRIRRARTSMRRITWSPARPEESNRDGWLNRTLAPGKHPSRFGPSVFEPPCPAVCAAYNDAVAVESLGGIRRARCRGRQNASKPCTWGPAIRLSDDARPARFLARQLCGGAQRDARALSEASMAP